MPRVRSGGRGTPSSNCPGTSSTLYSPGQAIPVRRTMARRTDVQVVLVTLQSQDPVEPMALALFWLVTHQTAWNQSVRAAVS